MDFYSREGEEVPIRYSSVPGEKRKERRRERERERDSRAGSTIVWRAVKQFRERGAGRHNKSPSTVDVTKMNCYIVLTNEGRDRSPSSLSSSSLLARSFFARSSLASYYVSGPSLLSSRRGETASLFSPPPPPPPPSVRVLVSALSRPVLQSAREARVLPVPIVSCMINGPGPPCSPARLQQPRTPAPFEGSDLPLDPSIATRNTPPKFLPNSNPFPTYGLLDNVLSAFYYHVSSHFSIQ